MIYQSRTDEELLEIMEKAKRAKLDWLSTFSRGPKKRPDDNIITQREYAETFDQICQKLARSISLRSQKPQEQHRPESLATEGRMLPASHERISQMQDENKGYRVGGQGR